VAASSPAAVVTVRGSSTSSPPSGPVYLGCLLALGEERTIFSFRSSGGSTASASRFALAGRFVAFVADAGDRYGYGESVHTIDLASGQPVRTDSISSCATGDVCPYVTALALSATGFPVWETTSSYSNPTTETITVHDQLGSRTLDSETVPNGASASTGLANLQVVGNQALWTHDQRARSASLYG
jgi:hypothetical protein